jgi:hypothetical protein
VVNKILMLTSGDETALSKAFDTAALPVMARSNRALLKLKLQ